MQVTVLSEDVTTEAFPASYDYQVWAPVGGAAPIAARKLRKNAPLVLLDVPLDLLPLPLKGARRSIFGGVPTKDCVDELYFWAIPANVPQSRSASHLNELAPVQLLE